MVKMGMGASGTKQHRGHGTRHGGAGQAAVRVASRGMDALSLALVVTAAQAAPATQREAYEKPWRQPQAGRQGLRPASHAARHVTTAASC